MVLFISILNHDVTYIFKILKYNQKRNNEQIKHVHRRRGKGKKEMQQQQQQQQQGMLPRAPLCSEGKVIKGKWRIVRQIGMGAFGEIYIGQDVSTNEKVAVKVEVVDEKKQVLRAEVSIMRKLQSCSCVPRFIACGRQDNINFLVMQLLGENLSDLRKHQPGGTFSLPTICRLAIEITRAIQSIHAVGILHRDIKPSNFVLDMPVDSPSYSNSNNNVTFITSFFTFLVYRKRRSGLFVFN